MNILEYFFLDGHYFLDIQYFLGAILGAQAGAGGRGRGRGGPGDRGGRGRIPFINSHSFRL